MTLRMLPSDIDVERGAWMKPNRRHVLDVPEAVLGKAQALGPPGRRWLRNVPDLIGTLERDWDLEVGAAFHGGSAAYVAAAKMADGTAAILKLHIPGYEDPAGEIRVLSIADGRGYARLLRSDAARGALLLERLGPRLSELGPPTRRQMEVICSTLERAWVQTPDAGSFPTGADKARWLRSFIAEAWQSLGRPCSEAVIDRALAFSVTREAAFDPSSAVLVHGDAHSANTLAPFDADPSSTTGFKLVDPDGLFAERAYDLGIVMRGWNSELLKGDALRKGRERCAYLSALTGEDPEAIWQWGFIERVSTGLFLMQTGQTREGRETLQVAEAWLRP